MRRWILVLAFLFMTNVCYAATSSISVTEGSGKNIASHSISEDAETKELQRVVPSTSAGVESGTSGSPLVVDLGTNNDVTVTSGTITTVSSVTAVAGTVTVDLGANNDVTVTSGAITETNSGSIKTAVELLDNAVDGNYLNTNMNIAGTDVSANAGVLTAQTQRVTIATDDECNNLLGTIDADTSNMATSLGNLDNSVDGNYLNVNMNIAGTDTVGGAGAVAAGVQRVTLASDDPAVALLTTIDADTSKITACNTGAVVVASGAITETNSGAIKTAVEIMDDWDDTNYCNVNINIAGTDAAAGEGTISAQTQRVTIATDDDGVAHLATIAGDTTAIETAVQIMDDWDSGDTCKVTIQNDSIVGAGDPVIDSYGHIAINLAAAADQVLVSSAANKQIWVYGVTFTVNVAGTVSFQDEDNAAVSGVMQIDALGGMAVSPSGNFAMPIWKLGTDKDLEVDVVTLELDGWLTYAIVSV